MNPQAGYPGLCRLIVCLLHLLPPLLPQRTQRLRADGDGRLCLLVLKAWLDPVRMMDRARGTDAMTNWIQFAALVQVVRTPCYWGGTFVPR